MKKTLTSLVIVVAVLTVFAVPGTAQGRADNAKACQKGGWENLLTYDSSSFANTGDCVSYAARGGELVPARIPASVPSIAVSFRPTSDANYCLVDVTLNDFVPSTEYTVTNQVWWQLGLMHQDTYTATTDADGNASYMAYRWLENDVNGPRLTNHTVGTTTTGDVEILCS